MVKKEKVLFIIGLILMFISGFYISWWSINPYSALLLLIAFGLGLILAIVNWLIIKNNGKMQLDLINEAFTKNKK